MGILGWIIKCIIVALVGILGVFIVLIGILLLGPIHYSVEVSYEGYLEYHIFLRYLSGIKASFEKTKEEKRHDYQIFWKHFNTSDSDKNKVEPLKTKSIKRTKPPSKHQTKKTSEACVKYPEKPTKIGQKLQTPKGKEEKAEASVKKKPQKAHEVPVLQKNEKVNDSKENNLKQILDICTSREFYDVIREVFLFVRRLLKRLRPKVWAFECIVGKDDPADTAELIAQLTLFYPLYYKHGIIRGNYEKSCIEGGFLLEGQFRIGTIIYLVIEFLLKPSVRKQINIFLRSRKDEKHGK